MRSKLLLLSLWVLLAGFGTGVVAWAEQPVNNCLMLPEIVIGQSTALSGYDPESCVVSWPGTDADRGADFAKADSV
jgi:hypothetical protein